MLPVFSKDVGVNDCEGIALLCRLHSSVMPAHSHTLHSVESPSVSLLCARRAALLLALTVDADQIGILNLGNAGLQI